MATGCLSDWARTLESPINADAIRKVADEQLRMIWTHMAVATVAATVFAMFFAAKMMTPTNHVLVKAWIAAKLLVAIPRVIQGQLYRRNGRVGGRKWRNGTDILLLLDGLVWGAAGLWVARQDVATAGLGDRMPRGGRRCRDVRASGKAAGYYCVCGPYPRVARCGVAGTRQ